MIGAARRSRTRAAWGWTLWAPNGPAVDAMLYARGRELRGRPLRVCLDGQLRGRGQRFENQRRAGRFAVNVGVPPPTNTVWSVFGQPPSFAFELGEHRLDVRLVLVPATDRGDEVAIPAPVDAERQVDVEVRRGLSAVGRAFLPFGRLFFFFFFFPPPPPPPPLYRSDWPAPCPAPLTAASCHRPG